MSDVPIKLDANHLSSIIACMLMNGGAKEYTMKLSDYEDLGLEGYGIECTANYASGNMAPDSVTVTLRTIAEIQAM